MNREEFMRLTNILLEKEEVTFVYDDYFVEIFEHSEGGYEGNIFNSKEDYENELDPIDGGVIDTVVAIVSLEFFMDIARYLRDKTLRFEAGSIVGSN